MSAFIRSKTRDRQMPRAESLFLFIRPLIFLAHEAVV
ncbi:MAG: hypothetical protein AOA65_0977 [Candidatus Bathyarchaeota archaeon BA1]|nr:MAG: hypothetical protein AOA65_0977 [Candidatus Bathyarchaeota archaeon BA1]